MRAPAVAESLVMVLADDPDHADVNSVEGDFRLHSQSPERW
ncbi:hypothetical protein F4560_003657 [Saccharothrix ecbatanensis]|uniref:Uncharacterized protein n=1 Tax=Saccharothrix ecbatanensis TaxID=1105145 RepID=A0A7W9HLF6_9PSEU|nr:hypothetical protein [Saccharothrix ecbatanensis]MBB5803889.1 hypothetical protein [Saccharothrix ecbatanensis]